MRTPLTWGESAEYVRWEGGRDGPDDIGGSFYALVTWRWVVGRTAVRPGPAVATGRLRAAWRYAWSVMWKLLVLAPAFAAPAFFTETNGAGLELLYGVSAVGLLAGVLLVALKTWELVTRAVRRIRKPTR